MVLIIEDDPESREFIAATVRIAGGTAMPAATVSPALALLEDHPPDVVVSDIALPEEDGLSFIRKLRRSINRGDGTRRRSRSRRSAARTTARAR